MKTKTKRPVHRAFLEELPHGHPHNPEGHIAVFAHCETSREAGATADSTFDMGGRNPEERALRYLGVLCDADHVL